MASPGFFLIAGLGNPGSQYQRTRHNVGFLFIDYLADGHGWRVDSEKMQGLFCRGGIHGAQVLLVKPQTYMNRSGVCVRAFVDYFKIPLEHVLIMHDDIDLQPGRIKMVRQGGAGGHNGIRSIIGHLGTDVFARMKIGVGRPSIDHAGQGQPVDRYVLANMSAEEVHLFHQRASLMEEAVALFITRGIDVSMNLINGRCN
ncbi:aminoacyl-tRNA hydrolase [Desulfobulbus alkaliphilus]|uniref:aminoacyl-tRNA hydrolase n=1 Tax=Desulfobulbus alkaliphilus TaxID=869814 RepID=UPI0019664A7F|nr:aminoacyl-tRNA hydrolase [Desulfobulbus alkaliphilus]MBM9536373.1 aminoacyl-tRNA hydrolase [Desulfobulbus alkaliphilus]